MIQLTGILKQADVPSANYVLETKDETFHVIAPAQNLASVVGQVVTLSGKIEEGMNIFMTGRRLFVVSEDGC